MAKAIHPRKGLALVEVQHAEASALATEGEATISSSLAVCVGACGSGTAQLLNGLYDSHRNHLPVLAIVAQVPSYEIGSSYFQETRPELLFRDCSHYCATIAVPAQAVRVTEAAVQVALGRGGVGVVVLPADVVVHLAALATAPPGEAALRAAHLVHLLN